MKRTLLFIALIISTLNLFAQETATQSTIKTETRNIGPFDKIKTAKGINVTLTEGASEKVEIHIENAEPSDVITTLEGRTLILKMKTLIRKGVAVQVYISYNTLCELYAGSGSTIETEGELHADKLKVGVGTDAVMMVDVDANDLSAELSAGRIEISGKAKKINVLSNAGGKFNASALETDEATVKVNTGGQATVRVAKKLDANAITGKIYYYGTPNIIKSESMGGKVIAAEE